MAKLSLNDGLGWMTTLQARHTELVALRSVNSHDERRYLGGGANDKVIEKTPTYDVKHLDRMITTIAREMRLLDMAIKRTNALTIIDGYEQDDAVLGELQ